jgi:salicylate biosynthesis isochorismate synthase/menaquinone-specific isochorismate synthase
MQVIGVARPVRSEDVPGLERLLGPPSLAWRDGAVCFRGSGEAAVLSGPAAPDVLAAAARSTVRVTDEPIAPPAPWFCGFSFDGAAPRDAWWESFPAARAFIPRLLLAEREGRASLTAFEQVGADGEAAAQLRAETSLQAALTGRPPAPGLETHPGRVEVREDAAAWEALVERALAALRSGMLRKVVLARPLDLAAEGPFDVDQALARAAAAEGAVVFAVRGPDGTTFLGASPERLVRVQGRRFLTQALAGSAAPADTERLSRNPKDVREHGAVVEDVRAALDVVAEQLEVAEVATVSLGYVTHLDARIEGTLREGVTPAEVALALHPTAAVGGAPRDRARTFLRTHERLSRGWYAGAVGWIGAEAADLRVALRCALVRGRAARIFVGAGVVEGSTPAGEWAETRRKAGPMLNALLGEIAWPR